MKKRGVKRGDSCAGCTVRHGCKLINRGIGSLQFGVEVLQQRSFVKRSVKYIRCSNFVQKTRGMSFNFQSRHIM